jgi:glutathione synthase/RimK-type ligase-like ATP-grasp enzyme
MPTPPQVLLVTASQMPRADPESGLLVDALADLEIDAAVRAWDRPADWASARLVVCRTPWDYTLRLEEFLTWADGVAGVAELLNPLATISWNAHKSYLLALERAGVATVPTILLGSDATRSERDAALAGFAEAVIKPAVAAGGRGALRVAAGSAVAGNGDGAASAAEHLDLLLTAGDALVQPFMASVADHGETSLVFFEGRFSHAVRKRPRVGEYRVHQHHGGTVSSHQPTAAELGVAEAAIAAAPTATAYARIDLVQGPSGPAVMEAELVEPELFLGVVPEAAERFARSLAARL